MLVAAEDEQVGQDKGKAFRVVHAEGSFVPPVLSFFFCLKQILPCESLCLSAGTLTRLLECEPRPLTTPSHLVHSNAFLFWHHFFSSSTLHQVDSTTVKWISNCS